MYGSAAQGDATRRLDLPDPHNPTYREQPILDDPYHAPYPNSPYDQPPHQPPHQPPDPTRPYPAPEQPYSAAPYSPQPPGQAVQPYSGQPYAAQPYAAQPALHPYMPVPVATDPLTGAPLSDKSKIVAGLLQLLLGFVFALGGVGRLYAGHTTLGVIQLGASVLAWTMFWCGFVLLFPFMVYGAIWLWFVIDGIVLMAGRTVDGQGRLMR